MGNKYFNDAIYGNDKITASLNRTGKLLRVFYPSPNFKQLIEYIDFSFKINNQTIVNINEDINSTYNQYYINNTNIVKTEIILKNYDLNVVQTDFAVINENFLVRKYVFRNDSENDITLKPIITSKMVSSVHNETGSMIMEDALVQYNHDYSLAVFTKENIDKYKINNNEYNIENGDFDKSEYTGLSNTSSISYKSFSIAKGEKKEFVVYIYINDNREKPILNEGELEIIRVKKINANDKELQAKKYWEKFVEKHTKHDITRFPIKIQDIYTRSILLLDLMFDKNTGRNISGNGD